jgi:hypothetical protein
MAPLVCRAGCSCRHGSARRTTEPTRHAMLPRYITYQTDRSEYDHNTFNLDSPVDSTFKSAWARGLAERVALGTRDTHGPPHASRHTTHTYTTEVFRFFDLSSS